MLLLVMRGTHELLTLHMLLAQQSMLLVRRAGAVSVRGYAAVKDNELKTRPTLVDCLKALREISKERGLDLPTEQQMIVIREAARILNIPTLTDQAPSLASPVLTPLVGTGAAERPYGGGGYLPTADEQLSWRRYRAC